MTITGSGWLCLFIFIYNWRFFIKYCFNESQLGPKNLGAFKLQRNNRTRYHIDMTKAVHRIFHDSFVPFADGKKPQDRTIIKHYVRVISSALFATICLLASVGIICSLLLLFFNTIHRNKRSVGCWKDVINLVLLTYLLTSMLMLDVKENTTLWFSFLLFLVESVHYYYINNYF